MRFTFIASDSSCRFSFIGICVSVCLHNCKSKCLFVKQTWFSKEDCTHLNANDKRRAAQTISKITFAFKWVNSRFARGYFECFVAQSTRYLMQTVQLICSQQSHLPFSIEINYFHNGCPGFQETEPIQLVNKTQSIYCRFLHLNSVLFVLMSTNFFIYVIQS